MSETQQQGANSKCSKVWSTVEEYVSYCEGDHAIQKILIANNGIGATKAIRSIRKWSYETFGDEKMVRKILEIRKI